MAPSCRNTVAGKIYARWSALTGWKPLATKESECIMLKLNNSTSFTFHSYHYHHAGLCLHHHHTRKLRWSLRPPDQCVLLTRPQASGGGGVLLTGTSQVKKSFLSVMDTHHILITDKENVHQPIRTIILRQCLLLLTLFYP